MQLDFPMKIYLSGQEFLLHGVFEFLGIFVAFRYYLWLKRRQGDTINSANRVWIIIAAALGAVLGARIIGSLEEPMKWLHSPNPLQYFWGNKTILGGLLGGLAGVELTKKVISEQQASGDLFTYPLILGMIIGRIGCFSAGIHEETYGISTTLPWGMDLGDGLLRHPVTLYEIMYLLLVWIILRKIQDKYVLQKGALFKIFMIAYLVFRFTLDFIKPGSRYFLGLGTIQLTALAGLLYYIRYILKPQLLILSKR